jgi:hypothetical protein
MVELWVVNVDFMGVDADDGSVFFMKLSNLPDVLAGLNDLVIEFVPKLNEPYFLHIKIKTRSSLW